MVRTLSAVLVLVLVALAGCASKQETPVEEPPKKKADPVVKDFTGAAEFRYSEPEEYTYMLAAADPEFVPVKCHQIKATGETQVQAAWFNLSWMAQSEFSREIQFTLSLIPQGAAPISNGGPSKGPGNQTGGTAEIIETKTGPSPLSIQVSNAKWPNGAIIQASIDSVPSTGDQSVVVKQTAVLMYMVKFLDGAAPAEADAESGCNGARKGPDA